MHSGISQHVQELSMHCTYNKINDKIYTTVLVPLALYSTSNLSVFVCSIGTSRSREQKINCIPIED